MQVLLAIVLVWIAAVAVGWLVAVPLLRRAMGVGAVDGLIWLGNAIYCRIMHRPTYLRADLLKRAARAMRPSGDGEHRGLIVVANHTGVLDPLLIQARTHFLIRWMMAEDMLGASLEWLLRRGYVIPVKRLSRDSTSLREAIRWVKAGAAVGVFPEGRITMPPREVRPFLPGVGLLVTKTRAPVLLVWISGTPETNRLREGLTTRSRARVEFVDLVDYSGEDDAAAVAEDLRRRLAAVSGWPLNDEVLPVGGSRAGNGDSSRFPSLSRRVASVAEGKR
jgi:1-acyl-sn-glycerol-3-phosphate acyltransferase